MMPIWRRWLKILFLSSLLNISFGDSDEPTVIQLKYDSETLPELHFEESKIDNHTITIQGNDFMLDGEPLHIRSGSLHYFRLPAQYWRDRLRKLKICGLNAVATYVEWSYHEPEERQYNFEGDRNIVEFIKIAAEEGLHVILRPGPYICAERDLGGLPYWLLGKYPSIKLRSTDKDFINETTIWMDKLFGYVKPLLFGNGGPIILTQVENEYGSYDKDMNYKVQIKDIIMGHVGTNALLYTTDGPSRLLFTGGFVPGALTTIDFGPTNNKVTQVFSELRQFMPKGPLMNSEFYPGWLTHWKENIAQTSTGKIVRTLKDMLKNKINFNFYMFYGGTNFEFTAGANYGGTYQPDITSYDYDAPLTEAGDPTEKYKAIRAAIQNFTQEDLCAVPPPSPKGNYGTLSLLPKVNLLSAEGRQILGKQYQDVTGSHLPTFESLRQRSGLVVYETTLDGANGLLEIKKPRDLVFVFVDRVLKGTISRMDKILSLPLTSKKYSILSLVVENQGRINYGPFIHDFKGILSNVVYNNKVLVGKWTITGYPLEQIESSLNVDTVETKLPTMLEGEFTIPAGQDSLDTYLDTTGWGKGYVWINGHNLGRYWPQVGPQITLYVPGVWLRSGREANIVHVLELSKVSKERTMKFIDYAILNRTSVHNL